MQHKLPPTIYVVTIGKKPVAACLDPHDANQEANLATGRGEQARVVALKIRHPVSMRQRNRRSRLLMASRPEIIRQWEGRYDNLKIDHCFACGVKARVERAHILARRSGGTDHAANLHLLCHGCHRDSEFMSGDQYWTWFHAKRTKAYGYLGKNA